MSGDCVSGLLVIWEDDVDNSWRPTVNRSVQLRHATSLSLGWSFTHSQGSSADSCRQSRGSFSGTNVVHFQFSNTATSTLGVLVCHSGMQSCIPCGRAIIGIDSHSLTTGKVGVTFPSKSTSTVSGRIGLVEYAQLQASAPNATKSTTNKNKKPHREHDFAHLDKELQHMINSSLVIALD